MGRWGDGEMGRQEDNQEEEDYSCSLTLTPPLPHSPTPYSILSMG
jgi:hypothetical protein